MRAGISLPPQGRRVPVWLLIVTAVAWTALVALLIGVWIYLAVGQPNPHEGLPCAAEPQGRAA